MFLKSSLLGLYHGSEDIERFSIANQILKKEKNLYERTDAKCQVKHNIYLKQYFENYTALVPITSKMIKKADVEYQNY